MKEMKHISHENLIAAIGRQDPDFDSHAFLQDLMTYNPHEYVRELHEKLSTQDPFQQTNSDIASRLNHEPFTDLVEKVKEVTSTNVRGRETKNMSWRKK